MQELFEKKRGIHIQESHGVRGYEDRMPSQVVLDYDILEISGHAIRIATELNLHQSFCKALEGDRKHSLRARLWYMLYVSHLRERMAVHLKSSDTSDRHLLYHTAFGLEKRLAKLGPATGFGDQLPAYGVRPGPLPENAHQENLMVATSDGVGWDPYTSNGNTGIGRLDFMDDLTVMNDSFIYEAFGSESASDVYNSLTSQFS
ncbi:hypothetical protein DL769_011305 [Monosporascus sp. CRB-8-3]|nr:hypothetical protein DL769_011305 [Monosporascus sp. CRB-8-3]